MPRISYSLRSDTCVLHLPSLHAQTNACRLYSFLDNDEMTSAARLVFYLCLALVAIILIDAVWVGYQFSQNKIRFIFTVKFLRSITDIVIGPLYIPIVAIFTMQLPCHGKVGCWTDASHVLIAVAAILIGSLYIALSVTLTGAFYSRDPVAAATSPLARPISRVMMVQLCLKTVLTVCFILLYSFHSMHWFLLVLLAVGTSGLAYLYTYQLPYYRFEFNVMRACTFWVLAWASLCLIITEYSGASAANFTGTSILFLVGCPFVAAAALMAAQYRKLSIIRRPFNEMESPTEIELKVRFLLEHVTDLRSQRAMGLVHPLTSTKSSKKSTSDGPKSDAAGTGNSSKATEGPQMNQANGATREEDPVAAAKSFQRRLETLEEEKRVLDENNVLEQVCRC